MPKIVLSYRRDDASGIAGRIFDRLAGHYGEPSVFMDIDNIPFGVDFRRHIEKALDDCDALIAIIGRRWLGSVKGGARIQDERDIVRVEIESALKKRIPVFPVLVEGAKMPTVQDLPASLHDFSFLNAAPIESGRDFRAHIDRLIRGVDTLLDELARERERTAVLAREAQAEVEAEARQQEVNAAARARAEAEAEARQQEVNAAARARVEAAEKQARQQRTGRISQQFHELASPQPQRWRAAALVSIPAALLVGWLGLYAADVPLWPWNTSAADYAVRGAAYGNKGDNDRAIADFDEAIRLDPKNASAYNYRGIAYRAKGNNDRAIADFDEAIRLDPNYAQAYYNRGLVYRAIYQNVRATADFSEAAKLDPKYSSR